MELEQYCSKCDGTSVRSECWTIWNKLRQKWEIDEFTEWNWCDDCDEQIEIYSNSDIT